MDQMQRLGTGEPDADTRVGVKKWEQRERDMTAWHGLQANSAVLTETSIALLVLCPPVAPSARSAGDTVDGDMVTGDKSSVNREQKRTPEEGGSALCEPMTRLHYEDGLV